jgi:FMN phosphatase YigB (HAD superfamily)
MKAVIFDLDDTLYNQLQPFERAVGQFMDLEEGELEPLYLAFRYRADETYSKINFTLDSKMRLDIPLQEPKVGEYPFTGRGFTGSQNIVLPEYELRKGANYHFQHGDTIGVYDSKSGNLVKQYIYDGKQKQWLLQ